MLSEAALPRALEMFCAAESSDDDRAEGLNVILVQLHRGVGGTLNELIAGGLRPYLTHEDGYVRMRGTKLLAQVIQRLPDLKLDAKMVRALVRFLVDRYASDFDSSGPCLSTLRALLEMHESNFPSDEMLGEMVRAILTAHHVPSLSQSLRHNVYQILQNLVDKKRFAAALRAQFEGSRVVNAFTEAMEGEKDPRCLLVSLRVVAALLRDDALLFASPQSELEAVQRAFDVTCVYFPIVFRPPANDPFNIKAEDLWAALHAVFTCHFGMAEHVISMLMDKLNLTAPDAAAAKVDSLKTLQVCLVAYGVANVSEFLPSLRRVLVRLVVEADEASIADEAVATTRCITAAVSKLEDIRLASLPGAGEGASAKTNDDGPTPWALFVVPTVEEAVTSVGQVVDSMRGRASGKLLACIAQSSALGLRLVAENALPVLRKWCVRPDASETQRAASFDLILQIVRGIDRDVAYQEEHRPMQADKIEMILALEMDELKRMRSVMDQDEGTGPSEGASAAASRRIAVKTLCELIMRPPSPLLSQDQVATVLDAWADLIIEAGEKDEEDVGETCLKAFVETGSHRSGCAEHICSRVLSALEQAGRVDALASLCAIPQVFEAALPRLLRSQDRPIEETFGVVSGIVEANKSYKEGMTQCCLPLDGDALVPMILSYLEQGQVLVPAGIKILGTVSRSVDADVQAQLASHMISKFVLADDASRNLESTMPAILAVLGGVRAEVARDLDTAVVPVLEAAAVQRKDLDAKTARAASECLASLLNKFDDARDGIVTEVSQRLFQGAQAGSVQHLAALTPVTKALVMRAHPLAASLSDGVLEILSTVPETSTESLTLAAQHFGVIIAPDAHVLNKASFAVERLFFQQRFFAKYFPLVRDRVTAAAPDSPRYHFYLLAAVQLIEHVPRAVMLQDATLSFLTRALQDPGLDVKTSALASISVLIEDNVQTAEPLLSTIIPLLLDLSVYKPGLLARNRALAIDTLMAFTELPYNKIHTFRAEVSKSLSKALDDPKRAVRKRAVACRNRWLILQNI
ncbi:MMS19 nucleotide excision repair protein-like [Hondaea fermentalgiana]|uniref:MMS19 nucleotide excision repair protein n=1 Tax=Hondaea fermentalgiana TaxID=2315210 RepID=A0A2R5GU79_9STRA|nr:MMS19 nucleotide excision repair protein-like [Hondaea fermentalgiana]|eukprot:GBG34115.1 MMS19 nucleotide excision repair protein-like [Hondaea fermentalgiana]